MATCTPYLECTNKNESWESLFKRLIVEQPDGSLAVRTCCADAVVPPVELALILEWDDIANVPVADAESVSDWNTFFGLPTNGDPFTSVTVAGNSVYLYGGGEMTLTNGEDGGSCEGEATTQLFEGSTHIISIDDQAGVIIEAAAWVFACCENLISVRSTSLTTVGDNAFDNCASLTSMAAGITTVGNGAFQFCTSLTSMAAGITTVGNGAFQFCTSLTSMLIPLCTTLGTDCTDNSVFAEITGITITVTCDASLLTCNAGAPDGDLCYLAANNTITVNGAPLSGCP